MLATFEHRAEQEQNRAREIVLVLRRGLAEMAWLTHYATAAAFGSEEAGERLEEAVERLQADPDSAEATAVPWLVNPEAKGYDLADLAAAGIHVASQPAAEEQAP